MLSAFNIFKYSTIFGLQFDLTHEQSFNVKRSYKKIYTKKTLNSGFAKNNKKTQSMTTHILSLP